ncbi:hypothetical protein PHET_01321, partial [Paragonimus heterotremus]
RRRFLAGLYLVQLRFTCSSISWDFLTSNPKPHEILTSSHNACTKLQIQ